MTIKVLTKASAVIGALCLMIGFVALSVFFVALNKNFYNREFIKYEAITEYAFSLYDESSLDEGEYTKYQYASINEAELNKVRDKIIAYFGGRDSELQTEIDFILINGDTVAGVFYTPNEIDHMKDVKDVFDLVKILAAVLLPTGAVLIFLALWFGGKCPSIKTVAIGCVAAMCVILLILGAVGVYMLIDFDNAFTAFHGIFFPQGNWQFSGSSNMLQVLPDGLFFDAGVSILIYGLSFTLVLGLSGLAYLVARKVISKRKSRE